MKLPRHLAFPLSILLLTTGLLKPACAANAPDFAVEDMTSLALPANRTAPPGLVLQKENYPDFTREMIAVQWRGGDPIYLFVSMPKGVAKPPVLLYLLSYPSETERFMDRDFNKLLTAKGFAAVGFAPALTGQRYHDRPMKEWFVSELHEALVTTVHDVTRTLDYLDSRHDMDVSRVGVWGEGSGGSVAVLAASVDPRLKAIDLLDPWADWADWVRGSKLVPDEERPDLLKPDFLKSVDSLDPVVVLPNLRSVAIRYEYITTPNMTPQNARDRLKSALPPQAVFVPQQQAAQEYSATNGANPFDWLKNRIGKPAQ